MCRLIVFISEVSGFPEAYLGSKAIISNIKSPNNYELKNPLNLTRYSLAISNTKLYSNAVYYKISHANGNIISHIVQSISFFLYKYSWTSWVSPSTLVIIGSIYLEILSVIVCSTAYLFFPNIAQDDYFNALPSK